jgi:enediyne biosynthesis protein E4
MLALLLLMSCSTNAATTTGPTTVTATDATTAATVASNEPLSCWQSEAPATGGAIAWEDATAPFGLVEPLTGMHGHAAAWGDVNGDHRADLVVGTFANRPVDAYQVRGAEGPSPDVLLLGGEQFGPVPGFSDLLARTSASVFADLDQDADLDLILIRNSGPRGQFQQPSQVFENREGQLLHVIDLPLPESFSGRSVAVADFDLDGDLDLVVAEDRFGDTGARLLANEGGFKFVDSTAASGLPDELFGLGVAVADLNDDGSPDLFLGGVQQAYLNRGDGFFEAVDSAVFAWAPNGDEDDVAGIAIADLDRNGWPDIVIGQHFNSTINQNRAAPVRLFLHQGLDGDGRPTFMEATEESGLLALPTKAPHVEVADLDNDGWPDILTTASADNGDGVAVFRHMGLENGVPRFEEPTGLGDPQYWVAGPTADFDRDGRVDVFLVEWEPSLPSRLLRNVSPGGHWLEVSMSGPMTGVGSRIAAYEAGHINEAEALIGLQEIAVASGYGAGRQPAAHFGLGGTSHVDLVIQTPDGFSELHDVTADQHLRWPDGC